MGPLRRFLFMASVRSSRVGHVSSRLMAGPLTGVTREGRQVSQGGELRGIAQGAEYIVCRFSHFFCLSYEP